MLQTVDVGRLSLTAYRGIARSDSRPGPRPQGGAFSDLTAADTLLSLVIGSTAEGVGDPYTAGPSDIGAAIFYSLVVAAIDRQAACNQLDLNSKTALEIRMRQLAGILGLGNLRAETESDGSSAGRR